MQHHKKYLNSPELGNIKYKKLLICENAMSAIIASSGAPEELLPISVNVNPLSLRGLRGVDFEITSEAFERSEALAQLLGYIKQINLGTEFQEKTIIYGLLYG